MSAVNKVVKNTWILYARMAITVFMSLYATRLTLAALGATDFGLFNLIGGVISMLTFLNAAMASATQRFMSFAEGAGDHHQQKRIFTVSTILHLIIAVLVLLVLEIAGYFLFNGVLEIPTNRIEIAKLIYQFMIVSTVFTIISVPYDAVINAHENMLLFAILSILETVMKLSIAVYLSYTTFDKLSTFGFLTAISAILLLIIRWFYCNRKYPECLVDIKQHFDKSIFLQMTSFAGWSFLGAASSLIANYGQGLVLNMFFGPVVNAAQSIAGQLSGQLSAFAVTMLKALNPMIVKSEGSGNRTLMLKATFFGSKVSVFLLMAFYIPVLLEMPYIFTLWLTKIPAFTIVFCRLLLIRNIIEQLYITVVSAVVAVGQIKQFQITKSVISFVPLVLAYIFFKLGFPAYYIYIAFIIYSLIDASIVIFFARKYCGLSIKAFFYAVLLPSLSVSVSVFTLSAIPLFFLEEGLIRLLSVCIISTTFLLVGVWMIGLTRDERHLVQSFLDKLITRLRVLNSKF